MSDFVGKAAEEAVTNMTKIMANKKKNNGVGQDGQAIGKNDVTANLNINMADDPITNAASRGTIGDLIKTNIDNNQNYVHPGFASNFGNKSAIENSFGFDITGGEPGIMTEKGFNSPTALGQEMPEDVAELGLGGKVGKFLGENQKGIGAAIGVVGAVSSAMGQIESLNKGITSANNAVGEMGDAKDNISEQNRGIVSDMRENLSEGNQNQALSSMENLKSNLTKVGNSNLSGGQIKEQANVEIASISKKLKALYSSQEKKTEAGIEGTMNQAKQSQDKLSFSIDSTKKEIGKMKAAKRNAVRNSIVDVAKVGANFIPGVGPLASMAMGTALDQFKKTNEYG